MKVGQDEILDVGTIVPSSRLASSSAIDLTTGSGSTATKSLDAVHGRIRGRKRRNEKSYLSEDSYWIV
jgi:hypothetical protein